jgi:hypothetical protein
VDDLFLIQNGRIWDEIDTVVDYVRLRARLNRVSRVD